MAKAIWNGVVLADSTETEKVEGNHYFPKQAISRQYFQDSSKQTTCPWKGEAKYYDIVIGDKVLSNGAWYYPDPKEAAKNIAGYLAFDRAVTVDE